MKGKLILFCFVFVLGASGFSSGEKTEKVFNPVLPSQLERNGSYDSLPLDVFGEEPYNLIFDGISSLYYPFNIQTSSIIFDSPTRVVDKKADLLFEREKNRVYLYESINLIVVFDAVEENKEKKLKMTFIDSESDYIIGSALFDHMFNQIEILSRLYCVCERKMYKIGSGVVEAQSYFSCGISNDLYRIDYDVYKRIDDSFVFSLKSIYGSDWYPIASPITDYFYLATEIFENKNQNTISIKKVNYEGVEVKRWDNITLEQDVTRPIINDNKMLIGTSDDSNSYTLRYMDLNTRKDLWRIQKLPNAKSVCHSTFYKGNYYQKSDDIAMRVKEDGTITFVPILFDPIYLTFRGQRYVLKGVPSKDTEKLFLELVRFEKDC